MYTLRATWLETMKGYCQDERLILEHFNNIRNAYSKKGRVYHTLAHLQYLFSYYLRLSRQFSTPSVVFWAIMYHDIVYETAIDAGNEEKSARQAAAGLRMLGVSEDAIAQVQAIILDTQFHQVRHAEQVPDAPSFLDMDLAILGSDAQTYALYAKQIRQEYRQYPDDVYCPGRIGVLERLLLRDVIYRTPYFFQTLEQQARTNLRKEIQDLALRA